MSKAINALAQDVKKGDDIKTLKKAIKVASCGKKKGPKKAVACCFESEGLSNAELIVSGALCAALPAKACTRKGGESLGAGSSCFPTNPCTPPASPSGAFLDPIQ